eukprot:gene24922-28172_t
MSSFVKDRTTDGREVFKRARPKLAPMRRSLAILLVSMQGTNVVIELKSDIEVSGVIEDTDPGMKVTLSDVKETKPDGTVSCSEMMTIE